MKRLPLKFPVSVKTRNEFNDYDYLDKLDLPTIEWLYQFHQEYLQASFNLFEYPIMTNKKDRLNSYIANNHRNNDITSVTKAQGKLFPLHGRLGPIRVQPKSSNKTEDAYNFALDLKTILIRNDQLKKVV